jgi:hypothetical protein
MGEQVNKDSKIMRIIKEKLMKLYLFDPIVSDLTIIKYIMTELVDVAISSDELWYEEKVKSN